MIRHVSRQLILVAGIVSFLTIAGGKAQAQERPEWQEMYWDILRGSHLGPNDGWFRTAVSQNKYNWPSTLKRYDANKNGEIERSEFPSSDVDFARLDRDHNGVLGWSDFDFSAHALTMSPGAMFFNRADADGDGKVTKEEFDALFGRMDAGKTGYLSLSDLQAGFPQPGGRTGSLAIQTGPSKETLIKGLFRQEIGSLQPGPNVGDKAPRFSLKTFDGKEDISLSKLIGPKPVVLIFGNFTCGPFRMQAGNVEKLHAMYEDRATFVMVYVREAHPTDGWQMESNDRVGVTLSQPKTYAERVGVAKTCVSRLGFDFPVLVDTMDDAVGACYSGMPSRMYLIDSDGKVAFKSGRGPFGFKPAELEQSLIMMLQKK